MTNLKQQICPFCFLVIAFLFLNLSIATSSAFQDFKPTPKSIELLFNGQRANAAKSIYERPNQATVVNTDLERRNNLLSGILWYLADSVRQAERLYNIYSKTSKPEKVSPDETADAILLKALQLSFNNMYRDASDTLLVSISMRTLRNNFDSIMIAESYRALARINRNIGDFHESLRNFERSLQINRKLGRSSCMGDDLTNMSNVIYTINSSDPRADSVLVEALAIFKRIGDLAAESSVYNEMAALATNRLAYRKALSYLFQSLAIKNSIPGYRQAEKLTVLNNIGSSYLYLGKIDSSTIYFTQAIEFSKATGRNPASFYVNMGVNYSIQRDLDQGLKYFQLAIASLDPGCDGNNPYSNPHVSLASPLLADYTSYKAHAFNQRFKRDGNVDDLRKGLETYMISLEMMDTLRYMYSFESKPLLGQEFKIHYFHALVMALDLFETTGDRKYLDIAFQLSGRNKSATLNEFIRLNAARQYIGGENSLLAREDSIKRQINSLKSNLIYLKDSGEINDSLAQDLNQKISIQTDNLRAIQAKIRKSNPEIYRLLYTNIGYPVDTIRKLLKPDEAMVDYTMVDTLNLISFTVTHDTVFYSRDTVSEQFISQIDDFKSSITPNVSSKIFSQFVRSSYYLHEKLFRPAKIPSSIAKIIVLPDEEIGFIPFEAFISDSTLPAKSDFSKLKFLNHKYSISYISSHEQLFGIRKNTKPVIVSRIDAFAPFVDKGIKIGIEDLPALKGTAEEIRQISKEFSTKKHLTSKAGENQLIHSLNSPVIVHISTHGVLNNTNPMETRLLLGSKKSDASLYLFEMLALSVHSPLVFLNACNTGTGYLQSGEGIMSMSRGFQFAGVPSLITTLWTVDDRASARIASLFYKNLKEGMTRGEALQLARETYMNESPLSLSSPYYWAAQILIGDSGPITIRSNTPWGMISLTISTLLVILAAFWVYLKKRQ
jgi:CHAT domain-containing protein/Tfp pilus assembly protein PilF